VANSGQSFDTQKVFSLTGGTSYTFRIQYAALTGTAQIRDATLSAIELSSGYYTAEANGVQTEGSGTYTQAVALTVSPGGATDYLILASADIGQDNQAKQAYVQFLSGSTDWGEAIFSPRIAGDYGNFSIGRKATVSSSTTFKIQFKESGGGNALIRNARITAIKLSDLGENFYNEAESETTDTTGNYTTKATTTFTPVYQGHYFVGAWSLIKENSITDYVYGSLFQDTTNLDEQSFAPNTATDYNSSAHNDKFALTKASVTYSTQFKTGNVASTAYMKNARIIAIRANTAESYSNTGHTTQTDSFSSSANTLYLWAHGLSASTSYIVAYYDANGNKVGSDVSPSSDANGVLATSYYFPTNPSAAWSDLVDWHAAVFASGSTTPATWGSVTGTTGFIVSDAFKVASSAIPEVPTFLVGILISLASAGIYYWLRPGRRSKSLTLTSR